MNVSVMAISNAVQRGEKIVKEFGLSFSEVLANDHAKKGGLITC
jgi:hypothetical protein